MHNKKSTAQFLLCAVLYFFNPLPLSAKALEYLYINASEGSASGGHVALRFEKETFHFQHYDGGLIRLVKHLNLDFDYQYRYLENRQFYLAPIELSDATYSQLNNYLTGMFFQQKQQNKLFKELNRNLMFFKQSLNHPLLSLKGAGLFTVQSDNSQRNNTKLNVQAKLLRLIERQYGNDFLHAKISELTKKRKEIPNTLWDINDLKLKTNTFVKVPYSFASQYLDISNKLLFLKTMMHGATLNEKDYFTVDDINFKLKGSEIEHLKSFQHELLSSLTRLLNSNRPDWGAAAFVLYARILSLDLSIQSGRFVFLDSFQPSSKTADQAKVKKYTQLFQAQKDQALSYLKKQKELLFSSKLIKEKDYSLFEVVSNYYHERKSGLNYLQAIRVSGEQRLPLKAINFPKAMYPQLDEEKVKATIANLEAYKHEYKQQITQLYQYDLFSRNCVTEIFSTIKQSGIDDKALHQLRTYIKNDFATFIPFKSFNSLTKNNSVKTQGSFRQQTLAIMYAEENDAKVFLREFNTISARDYKFNEQDSLFLFFTDDSIWSRPLFGTGNLLLSVGYGVYGGLVFPFDSGKTLKKAIMGAVMSLPELVFFNIRKGSYQYLLPLTEEEH